MSTTSTNPSFQPTMPATGPQPGSMLREWAPSAIVFSLLAVVLGLGHFSGWKLPRMSDLSASAARPDDWCAEHLVPESECVECRKDLLARPAEFGFCRKHGVAECVICHPELAQVQGEPKLPAYDTLAPLALIERPENNSRNTLCKHRVQFASSESAVKSGIDVDVVAERPMTDAISANGEIVFDPTRVAHLASRAAGSVAFVFKITGDSVVPGEILALIDASEVGQAKAQLLHAVVQRELRKTNAKRLRAAADGIAMKAIVEADAALQEAEVAFISARQALVNLGLEVPESFEHVDANKISDDLRFLGIPTEILSKVLPSSKSANLFPIRASHGGMVVAADCVAGEVVDATTVLFTVADPTRLWLKLSVRQEDARYVSPGLSVVFRGDDRSPEVKGRISWVSPAIDERTRTLAVRADLGGGAGLIKDKTFGTGRIILREEPSAVTVPRESVQSTPDANFVFVRDRRYLQPGSPKVFHVRQVRLGARDDQYVELLAGVLPGEVVVTKGSPVLLAQLLRSNLGAACCVVDH